MDAAVIHDDHRVGSRVRVHDTEESIYKLSKTHGIEWPFNDIKAKNPIKRQCGEKRVTEIWLVTHTVGHNSEKHTVYPIRKNFSVMPIHLPLPIRNLCWSYGGHMMSHQPIQAAQVYTHLSSAKIACIWFHCIQLLAVQPTECYEWLPVTYWGSADLLHVITRTLKQTPDTGKGHP